MTDCGTSAALTISISNFDIVYNSLLVEGDGASLYTTYDDGTNIYKNNIFATTGTGKAIDSYGTSFTSVMDYNNIYCEGATLLRLGPNYYTISKICKIKPVIILIHFLLFHILPKICIPILLL